MRFPKAALWRGLFQLAMLCANISNIIQTAQVGLWLNVFFSFHPCHPVGKKQINHWQVYLDVPWKGWKGRCFSICSAIMLWMVAKSCIILGGWNPYQSWDVYHRFQLLIRISQPSIAPPAPGAGLFCGQSEPREVLCSDVLPALRRLLPQILHGCLKFAVIVAMERPNRTWGIYEIWVLSLGFRSPVESCYRHIIYTLWLFNIAMEAMVHRNRWFTY